MVADLFVVILLLFLVIWALTLCCITIIWFSKVCGLVQTSENGRTFILLILFKWFVVSELLMFLKNKIKHVFIYSCLQEYSVLVLKSSAASENRARVCLCRVGEEFDEVLIVLSRSSAWVELFFPFPCLWCRGWTEQAEAAKKQRMKKHKK